MVDSPLQTDMFGQTEFEQETSLKESFSLEAEVPAGQMASDPDGESAEPTESLSKHKVESPSGNAPPPPPKPVNPIQELGVNAQGYWKVIAHGQPQPITREEWRLELSKVFSHA
ncbi:MAG: hypothetical protein OEW12_03875 [Deltaproteobacteria bacterium]|nr:hypothetical protein [Deltaproteobacteria bacterium]